MHSEIQMFAMSAIFAMIANFTMIANFRYDSEISLYREIHYA